MRNNNKIKGLDIIVDFPGLSNLSSTEYVEYLKIFSDSMDMKIIVMLKKMNDWKSKFTIM